MLARYLPLIAAVLLASVVQSASAARVLLITDTSGITYQETLRRDAIASWGHTVTTLWDASSQAEYDAALAQADVVYVTEEVSDSDIGYKLRSATIGVVYEEIGLDDKLGISTSTGADDQWSDEITITDNTHPITASFPMGTIKISDWPQQIVRTKGNLADGWQELGQVSGFVSFGVTEKGATLANSYAGSDTAAGRRVRLPIAGESYNWEAINAGGLQLIHNALAWASPSHALHLKLDESSGTIANDSSGSENHGEFVNSPTLNVEAIHYRGVELNTTDTNDRIDLPHTVVDGATAVSIAWWMKTSKQGPQAILSGANSAVSNACLVFFQNATTFQPYHANSAAYSLTIASVADDRWTHFAYSFNRATGRARFYRDGKLIDDRTLAAPGGAYNIAPDGLLLGQEQDSVGGGFDTNQLFAGSLDDVRVYRREITSAEVAELYGLVGHYRLNETSGTIAEDSSGSENDGVYVNGQTLGVEAIRKTGVEFSMDENDRLELPNRTLNKASQFSVSWWMKVPAARPLAILSGANAASADEIYLEFNSASSFRVFFDNTEAYEIPIDSVATNTWIHFTYQYSRDTGEAEFYRDGKLIDARTIAPQGGEFQIDLNGLVFGQNQGSVGGGFTSSHAFVGTLDDLQLYNRTLTAAEITALYGLVGQWNFDDGSGTTIAESSGLASDAEFSSGTPTWIDGVRGKALHFDGTSDAKTLEKLEPPERGAVAFWFRSEGPSTQRQRLWSLDNAFEVRQEAGGVLHADVYIAVAQNEVTTIDPVDTKDRWYHVVTQYDATDGSYEVYLDGVRLPHADSSANLNPQEMNNFLSFARGTENVDRFTGALDEFNLYNRWLSEAEIARLNGLVGWYKFDETIGTTALDSSGAGNHAEHSGAPQWIIDGKIDGAIELNGSDETLESTAIKADLNGYNGFAAAAWVRADVTNVDMGIFFGKTPSGADDNIGLRYDKDGFDGGGENTLKASVSTAAGNSSIEGSSNTQFNGWQHLVMSWRPGEPINLWIDGVLSDTTFSATSIGPTIEGVERLLIGQGAKLQYWDGKLDDMRFYNRAITQEEVHRLYYGSEVVGPRIIEWVEIANP